MAFKRMLVILVAGLALMPAAPAGAHGEIRGTNPKAGSRVAEVPQRVAVTLTEAPGPGSQIKAVDGCKRKVQGTVAREGNDLGLAVKGGEPGRWTVSYRAISSVDGHLTRDRFAFAVDGRKDCSKEGTEIGGGKDTRVASPDGGDDGSSFPIVPFVIGTAVVIALALVLRRRAVSGA